MLCLWKIVLMTLRLSFTLESHDGTGALEDVAGSQNKGVVQGDGQYCRRQPWTRQEQKGPRCQGACLEESQETWQIEGSPRQRYILRQWRLTESSTGDNKLSRVPRIAQEPECHN